VTSVTFEGKALLRLQRWIIASFTLVAAAGLLPGQQAQGVCADGAIGGSCADTAANAVPVQNGHNVGLPDAARLKGGVFRRSSNGTILLGPAHDSANTRTIAPPRPGSASSAAAGKPVAAHLANRSPPRSTPAAAVPATALAQPPGPAIGKPGQVARNKDGELDVIAGAARTLRTCPTGVSRPACDFDSLAAALAAAQPGDTIILSPGLYPEGAVVGIDRLTLRGEPGAHLQGHAVQGKAALVVKGHRVVIDGIECSDIAVRDRNGACIRAEGHDLTVRNVHFHDNEQGILSGPASGTLLVENSLFERNGRDGQAHGVYISPSVETFVFRNNRVLNTVSEGHGVKSRAHKTVIEGNVIASLDGKDSRAIDIPNGGDIIIRGNILEKGPNSVNWQMIGIALENGRHKTSTAAVEGNMFIFDADRSAFAEVIDRLLKIAPPKGRAVLSRLPGPIDFRNNTLVGAKEIGVTVPAGSNRMFRSRSEAGLPPYPALPDPPVPTGQATQ
jgi:hypothetical protein